ncbi:Integrase catalytic domain-containing protein [Camponotus japonicus]
MYSDNGTTFLGAQKQLKELYNFYNTQHTQFEIKQFLYNQKISWNFIPPNAPHFGGLWEAAVKSAKYHMARIIGKAHLTFEEMQTVLSEIEAILNSRPITALSEDPNDLAYLSPGHFLVGTTLNSFPCNNISDVNENRLTRWQRVEQVRQHFWQRWSNEYLHSLQERSKWKTNKGTQLSPNQLVLIKQQNLAPLQWPIGRVQSIHPGSDNVARTATIKTAQGTFVRPLSRIAILPIDSPSDNR